MSKDWNNLVDDFGRKVLEFIDPEYPYIPSYPDHNAVTRALRDPNFIRALEQEEWFDLRTCKVQLSRIATLYQMAVYDAQRGPEGDNMPIPLRSHWYEWYKVDFAQPLTIQLGEDPQKESWGNDWSGRQSQVYAEFVDSYQTTYLDMWVEDSSRMMTKIERKLFEDCKIILCIEKDSLFNRFQPAAKALGAASLLSGKGVPSKAAIELLLRQHFGWENEWDPFYDRENPLIILHITDHDYMGESVIGPAFGNQAYRYTTNIREARIGIKPEDLKAAGYDPMEKWYEVKVSNSGHVDWAFEKALFEGECEDCGRHFAVLGYYGSNDFPTDCPHCNYGKADPETLVPKRNPSYGFEIESMKSRDYYGLIVDTLLQLLDFDYIVQKLREECTASSWSAAERVRDEILANNPKYQALMEAWDRLNKMRREFADGVFNEFWDLGNPHENDWEDLEDDPEPEDFRNYVQTADEYAQAWRPFSSRKRTDKLVEFLQDEYSEKIEKYENQNFDWVGVLKDLLPQDTDEEESDE